MVGSATHPDDIPLGPDHPTLDGLPTIHLQHDGEVIRSAEWIAGTVHRGAEKLFESRDYRQIVMLVDRHDWLSAFCSEIGVVVGIERALGLTPPPRAQHLRILLCELTRIAHHLAFLAPLPGEPPALVARGCLGVAGGGARADRGRHRSAGAPDVRPGGRGPRRRGGRVGGPGGRGRDPVVGRGNGTGGGPGTGSRAWNGSGT